MTCDNCTLNETCVDTGDCVLRGYEQNPLAQLTHFEFLIFDKDTSLTPDIEHTKSVYVCIYFVRTTY